MLSEDDIRFVLDSEVVQAIYLPDATSGASTQPRLGVVASSRLDPKSNPLSEADRLGTIVSVQKLLSKSPNDRMASATDIALLLEKCLAHVQQPMTVELPQELVVRLLKTRPFAQRNATMGRWLVRGALLAVVVMVD